jgi:hypothetical protein
MAKSSHIVSALLLLLLSSLAGAFQVAPFSPSSLAAARGTSSSTSLNVFGNKKPTPASAQDALLERAKRAGVSGGFWEGEWVCKDCGYIYNRVRRRVQETRQVKAPDGYGAHWSAMQTRTNDKPHTFSLLSFPPNLIKL